MGHQRQDRQAVALSDLRRTLQSVDEMVGEQAVAKAGVLPRRLRRGRGREDQTAVTGHLREHSLLGVKAPRSPLEREHLRAHLPGEAAVEDADEGPRGDRREPVRQLGERHRARGEIFDLGVVRDELVRRAAVPRERNHDDVLLSACGEAVELILHGRPRNRGTHKQGGFAPEGVREQRV